MGLKDEWNWRSRLPADEIFQQAKASRGALLGMELRTHHVVAPDKRGHCATILGRRNHIFGLARCKVIGMHEIGVQPVHAGRNAVEQRMRAVECQRVPADP